MTYLLYHENFPILTPQGFHLDFEDIFFVGHLSGIYIYNTDGSWTNNYLRGYHNLKFKY